MARLFDQHAFPNPKIKLSQFYVANGTCSDLWHGYIDDDEDVPAVAVKVWRVRPPCNNTLRDVKKHLLKLLDEWQRCDHVNIVPFLGLLRREGNIPSLVIPYYENTDVMRYLRQNPTADRLMLIRGLASGIVYLHELEIIHGDIKGSNVLVDNDGNARLCDVGISKIKFLANSYEIRCARWTAPELIIIEDGGEPQHTPRSDVYSFGMTALEILTGRPPFAHRRRDPMVIFDIFRKMRPRRPVDCPEMTDSFWSLLESCWCHDPCARLSMDGVNAWILLLILFRTKDSCQ